MRKLILFSRSHIPIHKWFLENGRDGSRSRRDHSLKPVFAAVQRYSCCVSPAIIKTKRVCIDYTSTDNSFVSVNCRRQGLTRMISDVNVLAIISVGCQHWNSNLSSCCDTVAHDSILNGHSSARLNVYGLRIMGSPWWAHVQTDEKRSAA